MGSFFKSSEDGGGAGAFASSGGGSGGATVANLGLANKFYFDEETKTWIL